MAQCGSAPGTSSPCLVLLIALHQSGLVLQGEAVWLDSVLC